MRWFSRKPGGVLPTGEIRPPMPKAKPPREADPADRDFTGADIWTIIKSGLGDHGMILRPGTGSLGFDKWGDGKYHLKCKVDPKPEPVLDLVTDDGEVVKTSDWNALSQEERKDFVRTRGARFRVKEDHNG